MSGALPGADRFAPYRPRRVRPLGVRDVGGCRMKVYALEAAGSRVEPSTEHTALAAAAAGLTDLPDGLAGHGLGFVVLHAGEDALWMLVDRWADGDILCQRLYRAPLDRPADLEDKTGTGLAFCVWEGGVLDFERRAFIETMMRETPDPEAYLSTTMTGDV